MSDKKIKLFVTDLDGCLTDGGYYVDDTGTVSKKFNTRDFQGLWLLHEKGVLIAIVTLSKDNTIEHQIKRQGWTVMLRKGVLDKVKEVQSIMDDYELLWSEVAFIGDDVNDIPLMEKVSWSSCPSDAHAEVLKCASVIQERSGGFGCVRDFADHVRESLSWE